MDTAEKTRKLSQQYTYTSILMHEAIARKAGLSGTDHKYLGFLIEKGQMTAGELSNLTGLTTGAVTGLIDRFEKKNLVTRQFVEDDRRKVFIVPNTKNIMTLFVPLYKEFRSKSEKLLASFSDEEIKIIETYLAKAIEIMNETTNSIPKTNNKKNMNAYILDFQEIDKIPVAPDNIGRIAMVGGKGANLGELSRIDGCTSAREAFVLLRKHTKRSLRNSEAFNSLLNQLTF